MSNQAADLMTQVASEPSLDKLIHRELREDPGPKGKEYFLNLAELLRKDRAQIEERKQKKQEEKELEEVE